MAPIALKLSVITRRSACTVPCTTGTGTRNPVRSTRSRSLRQAWKLPVVYDRNWPGAGAPVDEIDATLLTFKTLSLTGRFGARICEVQQPPVGQEPTYANGGFLAIRAQSWLESTRDFTCGHVFWIQECMA